MAALATMPGPAGDAVRRMAQEESERQRKLALAIHAIRQAFASGAFLGDSFFEPYVDSLCDWLAAECYVEQGSWQPDKGAAFVAKPHKHYESWCWKHGRPALDYRRFYLALKEALNLEPQRGVFGYGLYGLGLRSGRS